jgi:3-deoxy-D-manno-octulosonate 8-phosphate phosphatase (KDO 8-P phosphatase)
VKRISTKIRKKAQKIKLLLLDVDGVLTDGGILMDKRGMELKRFDVRDGHGIILLMRAGVQVGFLTGRSSKAVSQRAKELGVRIVYQNAHHKAETYQTIKERTGFKDHEIAYVGDDIVDLPVLRRVGLSLAVRGCWEGLKERVDYVTEIEGGRGAVREITELLLRLQGRWQEITARYYRI